MFFLKSLIEKLKNLGSVFIIFICTLIFPLILTAFSYVTDIPTDSSLSGYTDTNNIPEICVASILDGSLQSGIENFWEDKFSPHGILIKTYNSVRFYLFNECSESVGFIGKNQNIFQTNYSDEYFGVNINYSDFAYIENQKRMNEYLSEIESCNKKLKNLGKALIFYTATGKCDYCADDVPEKYYKNADANYVRGVDYLREVIDQYDIPYIDCEEVINNAKLQVPIFYSSGIHWSRPAEQICSKSIIDRINEELGSSFIDYKINSLKESNEPIWRDSDVLDLCNIFCKYKETYYEYDSEIEITPDTTYSGVLVQGDSYGMGLIKDLNGITPVCYINRYTSYSINGFNNSIPFYQNFDNINLQRMLDLCDVVAIEVLDTEINKYSYSFVSYLNEFLDNYIPQSEYIYEGIIEQEFDNDNPWNTLYETGIYGYENGKAWMQKNSTFVLNSEAAKEYGIIIKLEVNRFIAKQSSPGDTADVFIDDIMVAQIDINKAGSIQIDIPSDKIPSNVKNTFTMSIDCPYDFIPCSLDPSSSDTRSLALYLDYIGRSE